MLYLYIILSAKLPKMFAYIKIMQEFSTTYVRSVSRFGYCLSTLEVALERITQATLSELIDQQNKNSKQTRNKQFVVNMKESLLGGNQRNNSLYINNSVSGSAHDSDNVVVTRVKRTQRRSAHNLEETEAYMKLQNTASFKRHVTSLEHRSKS